MEGHIVHSLVKSNYYVECIRHPRGQRMRRGEAMPRPCCWRKEGPILCSFSLLPCLHCKSVKFFCSTELGHPLGLGICMHGVCAYLLPLSQEKQKKKNEGNVYVSKCLWKYFAIFDDLKKKLSLICMLLTTKATFI